MRIISQGGAGVLAGRVPQEHLKIARHFNAGLLHQLRQVPEGRPMRGHRFSRPCGTDSISNLFPALKRRAIFRKSLWDSVLLAALVLFFAVSAAAQTNTLSDAEIQGRKLAQQLCDARPTENFTNTGVLQIRNANGNRTNLAFLGQVTVTETGWQNFYRVTFSQKIGENDSTCLFIDHSPAKPNQYTFTDAGACLPVPLNSDGVAIPFANSDFWLCDLGLEFFYWPAQKILPKTTNLMRGRDYTLLESTNPNPSTNGYSRVVSWIDKETGGILEAEAYDAQGKLLKVFEPKSFKKINGQWELQEMEIHNVQTGSRTRLEFDLKKD
jgi:hypothetical protein